jgi:hypothetical protein
MKREQILGEIRRKSITAVLLAFIAPLILVGTSAQVSYAAVATPNFKVKIENSASSSGEKLYLFSQMLKSTGKPAKFFMNSLP